MKETRVLKRQHPPPLDIIDHSYCTDKMTVYEHDKFYRLYVQSAFIDEFKYLLNFLGFRMSHVDGVNYDVYVKDPSKVPIKEGLDSIW